MNLLNAVHVEDLYYYDGPLLSHYKVGKTNYFVKWADIDWGKAGDSTTYKGDDYLIFEVEESMLRGYKARELTLSQLEKKAPNHWHYFGKKYPTMVEKLKEITVPEVPELWFALEGSYLA